MAILRVAPAALVALFGLSVDDMLPDDEHGVSLRPSGEIQIKVIDDDGELKDADEVVGMVSRRHDGATLLSWRRA